MSTIPPDIYERISELAADVTNATLADDDALAASLYQRLLAYHEEQLAAGHSHPFLIETLADYTDDPAQAIRYYEQTFEMSQQMASDEPTQTILIGIGAQLIEMGRREQAEAFIRDGRAQAIRRGDSDSIEEADRLLHESEG
jgi:tetratricopeptide (TPR) repeat protein